MIEKNFALNVLVNLMVAYDGPEHTDGYWALHKAVDAIKNMPDERPGMCDFYVRDKQSGLIHRVGSDKHDSIWVDGAGMLHYQNMQNGNGCSGFSKWDGMCGYEFVRSDCGIIDETTEVPQQEDSDR